MAFHTRDSLSHSSEGDKFKIEAQLGQVPSEGLKGELIYSLPLSYLLVSLAIPGILGLIDALLQSVPPPSYDIFPMCVCLSLLSIG